jgi:hypothetical protein
VEHSAATQAPPQAVTATARRHSQALVAVAVARETLMAPPTEQTAATVAAMAQAAAAVVQRPMAQPQATAVTEHLGLSSSRRIFDL